ncbi:MAG: sulfur carrier protein ThiS [Cocleimonas sp.]|nr:sulfur carrier protein ThiS [Cocleimonas sp.]
MLTLTLNGEAKALPETMSLDQAIQYWNPESKQFAVAVNGEFIARSDYEQVVLKQDDQVELLSPIVGG